LCIFVDFFDAEVEPEASTSTNVIAEQLPEGFFDDPKMDAKVFFKLLVMCQLVLNSPKLAYMSISKKCRSLGHVTPIKLCCSNISMLDPTLKLITLL